MSRADSTDSPRGVYVQKPKADIYTVLLAIALVAILIACLLLFLEVRAYNYDFRTGRSIRQRWTGHLSVPCRANSCHCGHSCIAAGGRVSAQP